MLKIYTTLGARRDAISEKLPNLQLTYADFDHGTRAHPVAAMGNSTATTF